MTTPAIDAVLRTPELAAAIDECNELLPGVPANEGNLRSLLEAIEKGGGSCRPGCMIVSHRGATWLHGGSVQFTKTTKIGATRSSRSLVLHVSVKSRPEYSIHGDGSVLDFPPSVAWRQFAWSTAGLADALAWAKGLATRLSPEHFCPRCRVDGGRSEEIARDEERSEPPRKKLKLSGAPFCADCAMKAAIFD